MCPRNAQKANKERATPSPDFFPAFCPDSEQINSRLQPEHLLSAAAAAKPGQNDRATGKHTYGILIYRILCRAILEKNARQMLRKFEQQRLRMRRCLVYTKLIKIRIYHVVPGHGSGDGHADGIGMELKLALGLGSSLNGRTNYSAS